MTQTAAATILDLDSSARDLLATRWHLHHNPERVDIGVNKITWRVGGFWLASDFPRVSAQINRMQALLTAVNTQTGSNLAVPRLIPTIRHAPIVRAHKRLWWLTENLAGRQPDPANEADTVAIATGLAELHRHLREMPDHLQVSPDNSVTLFHMAQQMIDKDILGFTAADRKNIERSIHLVHAGLDNILEQGMQLIHGDPSNPNLRVHDHPVRLTGALDWDHTRIDLALADVATVAQTVVFRSGTSSPLKALDLMLHAYLDAGGIAMTLKDVVFGLLLARFESIAHHGTRFLNGEIDNSIVTGQADKLRTTLALHESL